MNPRATPPLPPRPTALRRGLRAVFLLSPALLIAPLGTAAPNSKDLSPAATSVKVSRGPGKPWYPMKTRRLADLPDLPEDPAGGRFGGQEPLDTPATGFFHTARRGDRWWLVDPEGRLFIHRGVASVRAIRTKGAEAALRERFGDEQGWANTTGGLLREHGFNGLGAWSDDATLQPAENRLVHTKLWNFMSSYGKKRGGTYQKPGHTGYPRDCPFFFDPGFAAFCDQHARQLAATKDDPWLLGHFTDNELPWSLDLLDGYLGLPADDPGNLAARQWLRQRRESHAGKQEITDRDREAFLEFAAETYFRTVTSAIRKHDPNHLVLGARFHGKALALPGLFRTAGRHLDVVSVNYYHAWTPDADKLHSWAELAGKPILITEWYAKAVDSGLPNVGGAGWLVKTQQDRGAFYQNFTLTLLESRVCVGWHWFKYADNDPADTKADPSNRDSNKGIVSNRYLPYPPLLDAMKQVNHRTHALIRHFDQALPANQDPSR